MFKSEGLIDIQMIKTLLFLYDSHSFTIIIRKAFYFVIERRCLIMLTSLIESGLFNSFFIPAFFKVLYVIRN